MDILGLGQGSVSKFQGTGLISLRQSCRITHKTQLFPLTRTARFIAIVPSWQNPARYFGMIAKRIRSVIEEEHEQSI